MAPPPYALGRMGTSKMPPHPEKLPGEGELRNSCWGFALVIITTRYLPLGFQRDDPLSMALWAVERGRERFCRVG